MLAGLFGNPGEGKSFRGSRLVREELDQGRNVYTNLHLNETRSNYYYFPTKNWECIFQLQDGLIVFDEGQFILDARNWQALPVEFRQLLQKGRHEGLDFVVLSQNIMQIDVAYRRLLHEAKLVRRLFTIRKFNVGLFLTKNIDLNKSVDEQHTGLIPDFLFATKKDFEYFNSHELRTRKDYEVIHKLCTCGLEHELETKKIDTILETNLLDESPELFEVAQQKIPRKLEIMHIS